MVVAHQLSNPLRRLPQVEIAAGFLGSDIEKDPNHIDTVTSVL